MPALTFDGGRVLIENNGIGLWLDEDEALLVADWLGERLLPPSRAKPRFEYPLTDGEIWLRAWCATVGGFSTKHGDATRYADICLKEFRDRFPPPKPPESQWRGTPLSELTDEEQADMKAWRDNGYSTLA